MEYYPGSKKTRSETMLLTQRNETADSTVPILCFQQVIKIGHSNFIGTTGHSIMVYLAVNRSKVTHVSLVEFNLWYYSNMAHE